MPALETVDFDGLLVKAKTARLVDQKIACGGKSVRRYSFCQEKIAVAAAQENVRILLR